MCDFFVISPNVEGDGDQDNIRSYLDIMYKNHSVLMGWSKEDRIGRRFFDMKNGDYVVCARGKNKTKQSFFAGRVASEPTNDYPYSIKLSHFINLNVSPCPISFSEDNTNGASTFPPPAIYQLHPENNLADKKICDIIERLTNKCDAMKQNEKLLINNHNLILTGAPGTGKTYLAKQIVQQLVFGEVKENLSDIEQKQFDEQCGFVQFHPSYDYTDFVEGLRPIQDDNGNVGFKRKDGVFKDFCKKALQYASIDGVFDALIQDINSGKITTIRLRHQESSKLTVEGNNIRWYESNNPSKIADHCVSKENIKKLYSQYSTLDSVDSISKIDEEIRQVIGNCNSSYYYGILRYIVEKIGKKFVFIIDEINRGEISKIFGELFFSIDPGYRGEKGKVKTQYQNLVEEGDAFHDGFFVPENVYIIGTMNDIDRSVESMDFAMRRRFAFKEITAKDSMQMLDDDKAWKGKNPDPDTLRQLKDRMTSLNNKIWHEAKQGETEDEKSIEGLSSAYHIGASYFLKLGNYASFEGLWDYHLYGLLFEYLRGLPNAETDMEKLKKAYYLEYRYSKDDNEKIIVDENSNE